MVKFLLGFLFCVPAFAFGAATESTLASRRKRKERADDSVSRIARDVAPIRSIAARTRG